MQASRTCLVVAVGLVALLLGGCTSTGDRAAPNTSSTPLPSAPAATSPASPTGAPLDAVTRIAGVAYGPDPAQVLDLYLPDDDVPSPTGEVDARPAIVLVHGGGWTRGSRQSHGEAAAGLAALGWATVTVDYRLAPDHPHPAAVQDVRAALGHVHEQAEELGVDRDRVVLAGASAGGHLSGLVALADDRPPVAAWVSWSGIYDVTTLPGRLEGTASTWLVDRVGAYLGCRDPAAPACADRAAAASPLAHATGHAPPTLLLHSTDELVPLDGAEAMREALDEAGVRVELATFPGSAHGAELYEPGAEEVAAFLGEALDLQDGP